MKKLLVLGFALLSSGAAQASEYIPGQSATGGPVEYSTGRQARMGGIVGGKISAQQYADQMRYKHLFSQQWIQQNREVFFKQVLPYIKVMNMMGQLTISWQRNAGTMPVMYNMNMCQYGQITFNIGNYTFGCDAKASTMPNMNMRANSAKYRRNQ